MAKQRNALRTGILMIVSLALVVFVIVTISGLSTFTQSFKTYQVAFQLSDDIGGLREGDDVRIGGLKVGNVKDIQIHPQDSSVIVAIEIPSKYPLGKDAGVGVEKTLTGGATINVDNLGTGDVAGPSDLLHGRPDSLSTIFRQVSGLRPKLDADLDKIGLAADSLSETGFTATATVQQVHLRLPEMIARYDDVLSEAANALHSIREFVGPSSGDFHGAIHNLNQITERVNDKLPDLLDRMRIILAKLDLSVSRAASAMEDIKATVSNTKALTAAARSIIVDNKSKLDGIITSLKATSDNLKFTSVEIRQSPWRVLYQPKEGEVANLATYNSVRQFAEGASSLDDAAEALRDMLQDKNADPQEVKKLMAKLNDSFANFQTVEQQLWKDIKQ